MSYRTRRSEEDHPFAHQQDDIEYSPSKGSDHKKKLIYLLAILLGVACAIVVLVLVIIGLVGLSKKPTHVVADMLVVDAHIWTGDTKRPWAEAFSVVNGRIAAVGTTKEITAKFTVQTNRTIVINGTQSLFVSPGFMDSHIHIMVGGEHMTTVQLREVTSKEEMIQAVKLYIQTNPDVKKGDWIMGGDWDHENWGGVPVPDKTWFDSFTGEEYPVYLNRLDGHMAVCNSYALKLANITKYTVDPPGGQIDRDTNGEPTGIVRDNAMLLVDRVVPVNPHAQDKAYKKGMEYVNSKGVTAVANMGTFEELEVFQRAVKNKTQTIRMHHATPLREWRKLSEMIKKSGSGDDWLSIGSLKGFVDGSLGSHTAYMFENYTDYPGNGLLVTPEEQLYLDTFEADKAGLQVCVHAIGDKANNLIGSLMTLIAGQNGKRDRRFRIEHAQEVREKSLPWFEGIIASLQPLHFYEDIQWAEKLLGPERIKDLYRFNSLKQHSAGLVFGSDWYVQDPDVMLGIYYAVSRVSDNYPDGFDISERVSVEDALKAYTVNAAYASFKENSFGRIKEGLLADFVVLDRDITKIQAPWTQIKETKVLYTVVNGDIVYRG